MQERQHLGWSPAEAEMVTIGVAPPARRRRIAVNVALLALTALSATVAGALQAGADFVTDPARLLDGVPYAAALLAILLAHESGHYLMCRRYGVEASLPYFLPGPPLPGTFGAFIRIRSPFPDRRALFDVGAAGPWAGAVVSLAVIVVGLARSTVLEAPPADGALLTLGDSLVTDWLTRIVLDADPARVALDPVAFAGWFGFLVTALNLLPVGQLDGGHVLYAVGRGRGMRVVPAVLIAAVVWLGVNGWQGWFVWALLATAVQVLGHPPTLADARPLGRARRLAALATFVLLVLTFVAEPFRLEP